MAPSPSLPLPLSLPLSLPPSLDPGRKQVVACRHHDLLLAHLLFRQQGGRKGGVCPLPYYLRNREHGTLHTHARAHAHTAYWPHQYIRIRPQALLHERADWKHPGNPVYGLFFNAQVGAHEGAKAWEAKRPDTAI